MWTLQTLNPNALELNRLWHEHGYASAVRLLDVSSPDMLQRLPVKVRAFAACKMPALHSSWCLDKPMFTSVGQQLLQYAVAALQPTTQMPQAQQVWLT